MDQNRESNTQNQANAEAWYQQGLALLQQQRLVEAFMAFEKARDYSPNEKRYKDAVFETNRKLYRPIGALTNDRPAQAEGYYQLGLEFFRYQGYRRALNELGNALAINPNERKYHEARSSVLDSLNQQIAPYIEAVQRDRGNAGHWSQLGLQLAKQGRDEEALDVFKTAVGLAPQHAQYHYQLAVHAVKHGPHRSFDLSLAEAEKAVRLTPNNAEYQAFLADLYVGARNPDAALAAYDQAIRLDPTNENYYDRKADTLHHRGKYAEAVAAYDQAIRLNPNKAQYYRRKGEALKRLNRYLEALAAMEQVLALDPENGAKYEIQSLRDAVNNPQPAPKPEPKPAPKPEPAVGPVVSTPPAAYRVAKTFDDMEPETQKPIIAPERHGVTDKMERERLANFLENGKIILMAMGYDQDRLDPQRPPLVPISWLTDGTWIWSGALAYYLKEHGIAPEPDFYRHIVAQRYLCPQPTDAVADHADQWFMNFISKS